MSPRSNFGDVQVRLESFPFLEGQSYQKGFLASGSVYSQRLLTAAPFSGAGGNDLLLFSSPVTVAGPLRILTAFRSSDTG